MRMLHKMLYAILSVIILTGLIACSATSKGLEFKYQNDKYVSSLITEEPPACPVTSFIVFSDPHIFSSELGIGGAALDEYLSEDRKLLRESTKILESLIEIIKKETADFVIIPGDLTKDGERVCHELCASFLSQIEASGKQVYVVPGNHDILNPKANSFSGDTTAPVPSITPDEFSEIYRAFGFKEALYRDAASLSYVVEPQAGLWLLALDACRYKENPGKDEAITDGAFSMETLAWVEQMLIEATQQRKAVMVMMHHGVAEHYKGQEKYFGEYIVDDYMEISQLFAAYNVRLVFTGHYHAQDITMTRFPGENNFLLDIETGSLVTYPCPYRIVKVTQGQKLIIRSGRVTAIEGYPTGFQDYAWNYSESGIVSIAARAIEDYGVKSDAAEKLAKQVGAAFLAHYTGDEILPAGQAAISSEGTGFMGWIVVFARKGLVKELWRDLSPPDNNVTIDLKTGQID
ncbi:MAG: metallophosphoesterase [Dehalococcoidales bacterium]|nr:metallophosphoesterase [Dehalococcoidales bacterium]